MSGGSMRWQHQALRFRGRDFQVVHFDVSEKSEGDSSTEESEDEEQRGKKRLKEHRRRDILERCETELGACLWLESNIAALRVLEGLQTSYAGNRVLELGAGAGACGIALARDGARSIICDFESLVPLMEHNVTLNRLNGSFATVEEEEPVPTADAAETLQDGDVSEIPKARAKEEETEVLGRTGKPKEKKAARQSAGSRKSRKAAQEAAAAAEAAAAEATKGVCQALAIDWRQEVKEPILPAASFDTVIVCDCLYENKESWDSLQALLPRVCAPAANILLVSAMLRKPFLEEFVGRLQEDRFILVSQEEKGELGDTVAAILNPPKS
eukprot:TRINITY_DN5972_c0_g1_i2.p1 TRINITY_DN5972_c0_g1~~TRINITY_DN5972_c0_g1_i2.p1  ORF type:complete len:353 (-),score=93.75 TRINITY_DN5972_c0_g1_i2:178-1158(-)